LLGRSPGYQPPRFYWQSVEALDFSRSFRSHFFGLATSFAAARNSVSRSHGSLRHSLPYEMTVRFTRTGERHLVILLFDFDRLF